MEERLIRASLALALIGSAAGLAVPVQAVHSEHDPEVEEPQPRERARVAKQAQVSAELALDTNARRQQAGPAAVADALAYVYATGKIEARRPGRILGADLDLGGKYFVRTSAEDTLVGRLALRWLGSPRPGIVLGVDTFYKDRFQRGDPWQDVQDDPYLACRPPLGLASEGYRCNRRDYRQGALTGSMELRLGTWALQGRMGASFLDYKPNRQFTYGGPDGSIAVSGRVGESHMLRLQAGASLRFYHPDSVTYRFIPSAGGQIVQEVHEPRVEHLVSGSLGWRYRGPLLLSGGLTFAGSRNNGDGMDVLRARAELSGAFNIGEAITVVASAAFQLAHYPEGNVFRRISLLADEDERQNVVALQVTRRLSDSLALVFKAQAFSNEFSGEDSLPFRRQVVHGGVRWSP